MKTVLVTGASGYIASRLIPRLLAQGWRVRCLARDPQRLARRAWYPQVEVVAGDLTRPETLAEGLRGIGTAYYLVHNMAAGAGYERLELQAARNFAQAARQAGLEHIIYLGGLAQADERGEIAAHLKSRIETGAALREAGVPVTEFRAGVIVGSGSVSFEMIRFIAELFPLMVGPGWLRHQTQPIATQNILDYLLAALETPACRGRTLEIGGAERMSYAGSMLRFAQLSGLKRGMLLLPFVPVWLMAGLIDRLTPVHSSYATPLVQGLKNDSLVLDPSAPQLFPAIVLLDYAESVRHALADLGPGHVERVWLDTQREALEMKHEGMLVDYRCVESAAAPAALFAALCRLGGREGWPAWDLAWQLRGRLDRLLGGPGLRGRAEALAEGGVLDFYRVERLRPPAADQKGELLLRSELKAPGRAWMEWCVTQQANGCLLEQTAFFAPAGLSGFLYWYLLGPLHRAVFGRLLRALARVE